jgi:hypothetical protein
MTTRFGVLDLAPLTLQDQGLAVLDLTSLSTIGADVFTNLSGFFSPFGEVRVRQMPSQLIADRRSQLLDIKQRLSLAKCAFLPSEKLLGKFPNLRLELVVHDLSLLYTSMFRKSDRIPTPHKIANLKPIAK